MSNENQQSQIAQGSLHSSHRNTHAIILKRATQQQQEKAIAFLNSTHMDLVIQQRLSPDKAEIPLKRGTFFINTYSSKTEPGFLVFLEDCPPILVKYNITKREREQTHGNPLCYIIRLRVSAFINKGSVLVASIDTVNHKMFLEDVYIWAHENIFERKTFIERRNYMKQFVEKHWIPDVRLLGGVITEIIQPTPLASFESLLSETEFLKVNFIPNAPGRRRFTYLLNEMDAKIGDGFYGRSEKLKPAQAVNKPAQQTQTKTPTILTKEITIAKAIRESMPDVYELFNGSTSLGKACVQNLELSKILNEKGSEIYVKVKYTNEFNRYEIIGLETP